MTHIVMNAILSSIRTFVAGIQSAYYDSNCGDYADLRARLALAYYGVKFADTNQSDQVAEEMKEFAKQVSNNCLRVRFDQLLQEEYGQLRDKREERYRLYLELKELYTSHLVTIKQAALAA